ncbi:hypothetical protein KUV51_18540 [Tateyamaria omphalii]|uniref:hypothetical protein n=1 Tax=Tateyamaria omphalii TaxID=299262 RepID=UPI001C9947F7|nr:hypothetical protein [Tateyamaria omphalii]MBY5935009.1 hypothetical protein [Tateyamaria omphalii]
MPIAIKNAPTECWLCIAKTTANGKKGQSIQLGQNFHRGIRRTTRNTHLEMIIANVLQNGSQIFVERAAPN